MRTLFTAMKSFLPPQVSFKLRMIKSNFVDRDLQNFHHFAKRLGGSTNIVVDVGANEGIYSATIANIFRKVIAVEPNPACVAYLRKVLPNNCSIVDAAISNQEGRLALKIPVVGTTPQTTRATLSNQNIFSDLVITDTAYVDVAVRTLDNLSKDGVIDATNLSLVKIDVEGHELSVLEGAKEILSNVQPALYIEIEQRHGPHAKAAMNLLADLGYDVIRREGDRYVADQNNFLDRSESDILDFGSVNLSLINTKHRNLFNI